MTYTFTNGSTSDATQVNTDFTDIINALTDGSADLSIGTLTAAGAVTFNGNVALGNASADDITFTGSVESHIPFGTNATYDIGAATLGPRSIYLGNGTKSTRIIAGTVGTSWTFTLPNDVSATGQGLIFNSSGTAEFRYEDKFTASKTSDYTATGDETIIPCAPAASMTITLPAASTMTGKSLTIIKTDSDLAKTVTIDGNASETINGATTYVLYTQYESVTIKCDGSNWFVENHFAKTPWAAYTATYTGFGTVTSDTLVWSRNGNCMKIKGYFASGTATAVEARVSLPGGFTVLSTIANPTPAGIYIRNTNSASKGGPLRIEPSLAYFTFTNVLIFGSSANADGFSGDLGSDIGSSTTISVDIEIPIAGWNA